MGRGQMLDKYNAQVRCFFCKKFRWGFLTFTKNMTAKDFLCGTCEKVTYFDERTAQD